MKSGVRLGLRFLFAAIFLTTAIGKLLDNRGFAHVLETYRLFPSAILLPLALAISLIELYFGYLLAVGRQQRRGAGFTLLMNCGYGVLGAVSMARGLKLSNCGCFGVFLARPLTWMTLVEDAVLIALSLVFFFLTRKHFSLYPDKP